LRPSCRADLDGDRGEAIWLDATAAIKEYGAVIKTPNGDHAQSRYVTLANQHATVMLRRGDELGLSPASRTYARDISELLSAETHNQLKTIGFRESY
jgi:phage terminase small subunit